MLELVAHGVLRKVPKDIHESPFLAVMVDETTNKEQLTFVIRWVNNDFTVTEDFLGLYSLSAINAQSIAQAMKNVFLWFQIPFAKLRSQCYDGYNTMAGARAGVATKVQEIDTCVELVKPIRFSLKREALLRKLKEESDNNAINVRSLCPTRWTVRAESLSSILVNYDSMQELWEAALHERSDTEKNARIPGIQSQMHCFKFLFCLVQTEMNLRHTDN